MRTHDTFAHAALSHFESPCRSFCNTVALIVSDCALFRNSTIQPCLALGFIGRSTLVEPGQDVGIRVESRLFALLAHQTERRAVAVKIPAAWAAVRLGTILDVWVVDHRQVVLLDDSCGWCVTSGHVFSFSSWSLTWLLTWSLPCAVGPGRNFPDSQIASHGAGSVSDRAVPGPLQGPHPAGAAPDSLLRALEPPVVSCACWPCAVPWAVLRCAEWFDVVTAHNRLVGAIL